MRVPGISQDEPYDFTINRRPRHCSRDLKDALTLLRNVNYLFARLSQGRSNRIFRLNFYCVGWNWPIRPPPQRATAEESSRTVAQGLEFDILTQCIAGTSWLWSSLWPLFGCCWHFFSGSTRWRVSPAQNVM